MPHEDGAAYEGVVATVSLGGTVVLGVWEKSGTTAEAAREEEDVGDRRNGVDGRGEPMWRILQEPGSLLITRDEAYSTLLHGIAGVEEDSELGPETVVNWELLGDKEKFAGGVNKREARISLTYRDVIKVSKVGVGILGRGVK
jgi:alkylated DNA repair protein alkB homolog 6